MMTFFTIKSYFTLAIVSLALHGLGFSFVYATAISAAQKWFPKSKRGLVGSIVLSGYGYGSLIWVPIQTAFVNLDEEAARMLQYQQAYQAAGKMMQIAQGIFNTLLDSLTG